MKVLLNSLSLLWCVYIVRTGYGFALEITSDWQEGLTPNTALFTAWFMVVLFGLLAIGNFLNLYDSLTKKSVIM